MKNQLLAKLAPLAGVRYFSGGDNKHFGQLELRGLKIPDDHVALLCESNGVEAYDGYLRLFGLGPGAFIDAQRWNNPDVWKFAWMGRASNYWCFGETAWGDQFAYDLSKLKSSEIFFLDALSLTPCRIAASFAEFWNSEFLRLAADPYDLMTKAALRAIGPLNSNLHLVYAPSPLLGGPERIENVQTMPAETAMICNGDIATQLDAGPSEGTVKAVRAYEDDLHRMRLELVWT